MPGIDPRINGHWSEEHHHWLLQFICAVNWEVECRIIESPLRTLHPVDDAIFRVIRRTRSSNSYLGIITDAW